MRRRRALAHLGLALAASLATVVALADDLTVSAGTSLTNVLRELGPLFEARQPGTHVLFNFGASDALVQQIAAGAPVDVLATADQAALDKAEQQALLVAETRRDFAGNALVLIAPSDTQLAIGTLADLATSGVERVAIGNPASVPAGRYARGALEQAGLWPALEAKAVFAQSVRQALDYVARGEVDVGFVYATDAQLDNSKVRTLLTVPTAQPITYPIALVAGSHRAALARAFVEFVVSPGAQVVFARYGFSAP